MAREDKVVIIEECMEQLKALGFEELIQGMQVKKHQVTHKDMI
jgi:hypothetical protein